MMTTVPRFCFLDGFYAVALVILSRSTLADWVGRLGVALQPLADRLVWHLLQRDCLHADDDPQGCGKCGKCRSIFP